MSAHPGEKTQSPEHLLIFSHVEHRLVNGVYVAHGGLIREIDIWARIFDRVTVAATLGRGSPKTDDIAYDSPNVQFVSLGNMQTTRGIFQKLRFGLQIPGLVFRSLKLVEPNTVVMARSPDNFGFVGALIAVLSCKKRFAKYAGQWSTYAGETFAYRFQRWFYRSRLWGGPVWVNAAPDPQCLHVVSLLNASMSRQDWQAAETMFTLRPGTPPLKLLFVGRISPVKGLHTIIQALAVCLNNNLDIQLDVVGDGAEKESAEKLAHQLDLANHVKFHGWLGRAKLFERYSKAHCLISGSHHQGLDKVILEAMTFALPVIATEVSVLPYLVNPPECGLLIKPHDVNGTAHAIQRLYHEENLREEMGINGRVKSANFLLDDLEEKFRALLHIQLGLETEK